MYVLITVPTRFYEFLNAQNWVCKLRMHVFLNPVISVANDIAMSLIKSIIIIVKL